MGLADKWRTCSYGRVKSRRNIAAALRYGRKRLERPESERQPLRVQISATRKQVQMLSRDEDRATDPRKQDAGVSLPRAIQKTMTDALPVGRHSLFPAPVSRRH